MKPGFFITFEGGEGSGKSTQARQLAGHLKAQGRNVLLTREPGGTPQGEALRHLLVSGDVAQWSAIAEAMLMSAAREVHVRTVIRPALEDGTLVISDRFMDSTRVYQGHAGGAAPELIAALEAAAVGVTRPDLTFIFDLDPEVGLTRASTRQSGHAQTREDRFERKGLAFHNLLREGFLAIARAEPSRCVLIDANASEADVFTEVIAKLEERLRGRRA